jgi:cell division protein FtsQ
VSEAGLVEAPSSGAVVVELPAETRVIKTRGSALLPSGRSVLVALLLLVGAAGAYLVARETSIFAVRAVAVSGAPPAVAEQVRQALGTEVGTSLLRVDLGRARSAVTSLPTVASVSFNRAFPHTLVVVVVPERAVAVIRQGGDSWLVSARGRIMASLARGARPRLPRIWVGRGPIFTAGSIVDDALRPAVFAVTPLSAVRFPAKVASVRTGGGELVLVLSSGIEVRLGDAHDVPLKLAVAANVLPLVDTSTKYVDVSVPERPVAGTILEPTAPAPSSSPTSPLTLKSQPEGKVPVSTGP